MNDNTIERTEELITREQAVELARPYLDHMSRLSDPAYVDQLARRYYLREFADWARAVTR
jgi:hypothetical protein